MNKAFAVAVMGTQYRFCIFSHRRCRFCFGRFGDHEVCFAWNLTACVYGGQMGFVKRPRGFAWHEHIP